MTDYGSDNDGRPHLVVVGGGFGGLTLVRQLHRAPLRITLLDRSNHHLFQPLLYQVALAALSPAEIAMPIRRILRKQKNAQVLMCEASGVDLSGKRVLLNDGGEISYDYLTLAAGATTNYFGKDEWGSVALGLKDLDDAIEIRRRVLMAFEQAEREQDPEERRRLLTFIVIGGGPTGVELAGAIAELGRVVLAQDFRRIDPRSCRVIQVEAGDRILAPFEPKLSQRAQEQLQSLGVELRLNCMARDITAEGLQVDGEFIPAATILWAAGIKANALAADMGVELDRGGRLVVEQDCSIPGHPEAYAIGDLSCFIPQGKERPLPGISPVAIQQARYLSNILKAKLAGKESRKHFTYKDKGIMATIGRSRAVAQTKRLQLSGWWAWITWLLVHIWFLIGYRNRLIVMFNWFLAYLTHSAGARLVTGSCSTPGSRANKKKTCTE